jgi:hypothetical protein
MTMDERTPPSWLAHIDWFNIWHARLTIRP